MAEATGGAGVPGAACMINALPDDLLLRVISYLDSREAVHTCLLSRRWRDLWRFVPRINASFEEFHGMAATDEECDALFKKFLNRFLVLRHPTPLDEFRLCYNVPWGTLDISADSADANLWIGYALQCRVRSVKVSGWDARLHLEPALFASECFFLTTLDLFNVVLLPGFFQNLQTGCTALECLLLSDCCIDDVEISSQTVKVFTIDDDSNFISYEQPCISIPSLMHLAYSVRGIIPLLKNMESLVTASVSVGNDDTQVDDIRQFLESLSGVTNLDFNYRGKTLEMQANFQWCPNLNNLTMLTLGEWCLHSDLYALIVFLQNSPSLTKLILEISERDAPQKFNGELEERCFTCELLKIVEIVCPADREDDPMLNGLKRFLDGNGISPDQIEINYWE